jgi:SAM-dependent MidA family methyltransferase
MAAPARLPEPDAAARAASAELVARIADEIRRAGGALPFARYMELALYEPGLGYYANSLTKFGASGDFVTAPELTPLFGRTLARTVAAALAAVGAGGEVLELGAGSGALAVQLLGELARLGRAPRRYRILEVSGALAERQRRRIGQCLPELAGRVEWLTGLPERVAGVVLGNEVLDVLPAHVVGWKDDSEIVERCVGVDGEGRLVWRERPAGGALLAAAHAIAAEAGLEPPYLSEIGLAAPALAATLAERLEHGLLLLVDYGFGRREYYHPQRRTGTLMCHYRMHALTDPLQRPGLQDISVHADFSAVARAALATGARLAGYTTQARFLIDAGITALLAEGEPRHAAQWLPQSSAVQRLLSPAEMGELFKVIGFVRGDLPALPGFGARGLDHAL